MAIIPQDIITTHILRRLPSKSVGRFRCVSKEWLSLLTDPQFIKTHQNTLNTNRFIFESNYGSLCSSPYDNKHEATSTINLDLHHLCILGSANGLVLVAAKRDGLLREAFKRFVLNLTTKVYVEVPTKFSGIEGFGYDSVSDDYNIVVLSKSGNYDGNVYVYSLRTNTMKMGMSKSPYIDHPFRPSPGVCVNGFLHWILSKDEKPVIVAFSLADETFSELPPPNLADMFDAGIMLNVNSIDMFDVDIRLAVLGEKLAIYNGLQGDIWLMNEYGVHKSWTKIVVHGFDEYSIIKAIDFYDNGKILLLTSHYQLMVYDVEKRTFCTGADVDWYMKMEYFMGTYTESLVSPKFS